MSTGFLTGLNNRVKNATSSTLGQFNNSKFVRGTKSFLSSNSLVAKIVFLILVVICFVLLIRWGSQILTWIMAPRRSPKLISGMKQGYVAKVVPQDPAIPGSIPVMRSTNQRQGLEFTYTCWLFINHLQRQALENTSSTKVVHTLKVVIMVLSSLIMLLVFTFILQGIHL